MFTWRILRTSYRATAWHRQVALVGENIVGINLPWRYYNIMEHRLMQLIEKQFVYCLYVWGSSNYTSVYSRLGLADSRPPV